MYVSPFLINTCDFNALIFEKIVKNVWAIIEDIDKYQRSGEKNVKKQCEKKKTIIPKFYKVKELTLVDICTKGLRPKFDSYLPQFRTNISNFNFYKLGCPIRTLFVLVLTQEHYNMVVIGNAEDGREYV